MRTQDVKIHEGFGNAQMPYMMRLTHLPTGATVEGNCKNETSKPNLQTTLWAALQKAVLDAEPDGLEIGANAPKGDENAYLREMIAQMQAQIDALSNGKPPRSTPVNRAKRGKPSKMTAEQRKAVGQRLKAAREAKSAPKEPEPDLQKMLAEQMRPPTVAPAGHLGVGHPVRGGTVVQVSPEAEARGFKP